MPASSNIFAMWATYFSRIVLVLVVAVVRLVGQAEAALSQVEDVAVGLPGVGVDVGAERLADALAAQFGQGANQVVLAVDRLDLRQLVLDRRQPEFLDPILVHEAGEQVADLLGLGAGGVVSPGGDFLDDRPEVGLGLLPKGVERAVGRAVGRDLGRIQPRAVDVPEQVVLRPDLRINA